jgi:hypothetical protein
MYRASDQDGWLTTYNVRMIFEHSCRAMPRTRGCVLLVTTVSSLLNKIWVSGCDLRVQCATNLKRKTSLFSTDEVKLTRWTNLMNSTFMHCPIPLPLHGLYSRPRYSCNLQVSPTIVSICFLGITVHWTSHPWCRVSFPIESKGQDRSDEHCTCKVWLHATHWKANSLTGITAFTAFTAKWSVSYVLL